MIRIKYGDRERVKKLKYIGKFPTSHITEKPSIEKRERRMKLTFRFC